MRAGSYQGGRISISALGGPVQPPSPLTWDLIHACELESSPQMLPDFQTQLETLPPAVDSAYPLDRLVTP